MKVVNDVYEEDEPDIVVCAHIIETIDKPTQANVPPTDVNHQDRHPNPHREFELIMYHTSQRVNNKDDVFVISYDPNVPELISHRYNTPCKGSIIDYADAMRLK
jgi:hypothetical protein